MIEAEVVKAVQRMQEYIEENLYQKDHPEGIGCSGRLSPPGMQLGFLKRKLARPL